MRHPTQVRAECVASVLAADIGRLLKQQPTVTVLASGGNSPGEILQALSHHPLDWSRVIFSLTDERLVHQSHANSNFGLLLRSLGPNVVSQACFVPLWTDDDSDAESALVRVNQSFGATPNFDVALLGMGLDGHTASLFSTDRLRTLATIETDASFVAALPDPLPPEAPWPRITATYATLARVRFPHLLLFGAHKERILFEAMSSDGPPLPVTFLFSEAKHSIMVHTCTTEL